MHNILFLFAKGLSFLKRNGIIKTLRKILIYVNKLKKIDKFIRLSQKERKLQENTKFNKDIKISIITPLYNTPENFLVEMIESVISQTYKNFELCLTDGSDKNHKYVEDICKKYANKDYRIIYKKLEMNEGISGNSNRAIEMSTGDYIGLLDHDDVLHPSALFDVMKVITEKDADFIFTDEAKFSSDTRKIIAKHFKPDYGLDTLRSCNYICHFSVFSKKIKEKAGVFRNEFDGSQDHDLILRYTDNASKICHIPKLSYFWRSHESSVAADISSKLYAIEAGKKTVKQHLKQHGFTVQVESTKVCSTIYQIIYKLTAKPMVSIIIPNKDNISLLKTCLNTIINKTTYDNYEIIIVENNSIENTTFTYYEHLKKLPNIRVVYWEGKIFNYSKINNFGVHYSNGTHIIFINNDVEIITPNWIEEMLMYSQRDDVGAVGVKLYYPDNTIQHAGVLLNPRGIPVYIYNGAPSDTIGYMERLHFSQNMSAVTASCMMVKRKVFNEAGFFTPELSVSYNDVDLCMKIRKAGYLIVWTPFVEAYHYKSKKYRLYNTYSKRFILKKEKELFQKKWAKELKSGDPYYNPNLTLDIEDFSIK